MRGIHRTRDHDRAWGSFRSPCWSELIKIFGIVGNAWSQDKALQLSGQMRDRTPSNACARKIPAPIKPISAVIASIIAIVLYAPAEQKTRAALHSQKHFRRANPNRNRARLPRNRCQGCPVSSLFLYRNDRFTMPTPPHFRRVRVAINCREVGGRATSRDSDRHATVTVIFGDNGESTARSRHEGSA